MLDDYQVRAEMTAATVTHVVQECRNVEDWEPQTLRVLSRVREIPSMTESSSRTSRDSLAVPGPGGHGDRRCHGIEGSWC